MKIAVIADFHGNNHGLEAILEDIEKEGPDVTVCAGDLVCPYQDSVQTWQTIKELNIPLVRGNQEDYILEYHDPDSSTLVKSAVRLGPVRFAARLFTIEDIQHMAALPLTHQISGPDDKDVLVCHASPVDTRISFAEGIDEEMAQALTKVQADVIVAGHLHKPWSTLWEGKLLALVGSGGVPLNGNLGRVEYAVLEYRAKVWRVIHKSIPYDHEGAIQSVIESDFLAETGPVGWIMFDELVTQTSHLMPFLSEFCPHPFPDEEDYPAWEQLAIDYLTRVGRWDIIKEYL